MHSVRVEEAAARTSSRPTLSMIALSVAIAVITARQPSMAHGAITAGRLVPSSTALVAVGQSSAAPANDPRYRAGLGLLNRGMHAEAAVELRSYLDTAAGAPEEATARYSLAICLVRLGRPADAAKELDQVLAAPRFEFTPDALLLRAQCAMEPDASGPSGLGDGAADRPTRGKELDLAASLLERLMREHPDFAQLDRAALLRGEALLRAGRHHDAVVALRDAAARQPHGAAQDRADILCAIAEIANHEDAAAADRLASLRSRLPQGRTSRQATLMEAECLHRLRRFEPCVALCDGYLDSIAEPGATPDAVDSAAAAVVVRLRWASCDELGASAFAAGDYPAAEGWYSRIASSTGGGSSSAGRDSSSARSSPVAAPDGPDAGVRADALLRLAISVQRQGRPAEALPLFDELLRGAPSETTADHARFERGQVLLAMKRLDEARVAFESVVADAVAPTARANGADAAPGRGPNEPVRRESPCELPALRLLAAIASTQGRSADAAALLGRIAAHPDAGDAGAEALIDQGAILLSMGDHAGAEAALHRFSSRHPDHPRALEAQARCAVAIARQGRTDDAIKAFELLESDRRGDESSPAPSPADPVAGADATRTFDAIGRDVSLDPRLDQPLAAVVAYEHAMVLMASDRPSDAAARLRALLADSVPPLIRARAGVELARLAVERGDHREAIARLDDVAAACGVEGDAAPGDRAGSGIADVVELATYLRGVCQLRLGDPSVAAETLGAFLSRTAASTPQERGRHGTAEQAAALRSSAALLRSEALLACHRPIDAARELRALIDGGPPPEIVGPALLRLGDACAAAEEWAQSDEAFTRFQSATAADGSPALADAPAGADAGEPRGRFWHLARFGQGWAREQQGRYDSAIEAYRDVVARHRGPMAARAQFQVGECLFAARRLDDAVRELVKVDVLFAVPQWSAAALFEAGRCLVELNRPGDARSQFDAVIERFPETEWATLARERRDELVPASLPGRTASARTASGPASSVAPTGAPSGAPVGAQPRSAPE
ncbi:MAG: tetratricopeptide repeat protein [Phycisphaerales bacterium]